MPRSETAISLSLRVRPSSEPPEAESTMCVKDSWIWVSFWKSGWPQTVRVELGGGVGGLWGGVM